MATVTVSELKCEGAKDCIKACPVDVFAMRRPDPNLPWTVRFKVLVHGGKQAYARNEKACTACMACVEACPERAITVTA